MKNEKIIDAWGGISPDAAARNRMFYRILDHANANGYVNSKKVRSIVLAAIISVLLLTTAACTAAMLTEWNPTFEKWFSPTNKVKEMIDSSMDTPNYTTTQHGWTLTVRQTIGDEYGFYCVIDIQLPEDFNMETLKVDMDALMEAAAEKGISEDEVMEMLNAHGTHFSSFNYYQDVEKNIWYAVPMFFFFHYALAETTAEDFADVSLNSADEFGIFDASSSYESYKRLREIYEQKNLPKEYYQSTSLFKNLDFNPDTRTVTCMFNAAWQCEITGMPVTLVLTDPFYFDSVKHLITNDELGENKRLLASEPFHLCWTPEYSAVNSHQYELYKDNALAGTLTLTPISAILDVFDTTEFGRNNYVEIEKVLAPIIELNNGDSHRLNIRSVFDSNNMHGDLMYLFSSEIIDLDRIKNITIGDYEVRKAE